MPQSSSLLGNARPNSLSGESSVTQHSQSGGQGKRAMTILADQGHIVTVITDVPYNIRSRHMTASAPPRKGARTMHRSTLHLPTQNYTDYTSTSRWCQSGVGAPSREPPFGSQHVSRVCLGRDGSDWGTSYNQNYMDSGHSNMQTGLHYQSHENRLNMSEGAGVKGVMSAPAATSTCQPWTQYGRVHNLLGARLGPGVPRERLVRQQYNPVTGREEGDAWKSENHRTSGNRVLYNNYRKNNDSFVLG